MMHALGSDVVERFTVKRGLPVKQHIEQDLEDEPFVALKDDIKIAPAKAEDAANFLHTEDIQNDNSWHRKCQSLQRQARKLPAVYPTALSAAQATPKKERVTRVQDLRSGMVAFSYNPRIAGTAGHVFFINGRTTSGILLTSTNDAHEDGQVSVVDFGFYEREWGHRFQFGATWLNGYDFFDESKAPQPTRKGSLGEQYEEAIDDLMRIEKVKREKGYDLLADAIHRDIVRMQRKLEKWA